MSDRRFRDFLMEMFDYIFHWLIFFASFASSYIGSGFRKVSSELTFTKKETRAFKVFIYKDELENIREWVRKKPDIETGGDLFGLWIDQHTVVVQFVLGPGENCSRSTTSFYQDLDYLAQSGSAITNDHGLCHIGQWHSHHRLRLPRPSAGDEDTVWGNMPGLGLNRFVVFIATIDGFYNHPRVEINPFLFEIEDETGDELPVIEGKFCISETLCNPFRLNGNLLSKLKKGAESMNKTITFPEETDKLRGDNGKRSDGCVAIDVDTQTRDKQC